MVSKDSNKRWHGLSPRRELGFSSSRSAGRLCRPVVGLGLQRAAPDGERVVDHHAVREHFAIVGEIRGETEGNRR